MKREFLYQLLKFLYRANSNTRGETMFKKFITIIFLLLIFIFQNGVAEEHCKELVKNLYPSENYVGQIEKVSIKSLSESFLLGELLKFEIERIIHLPDRKIDLTITNLGKRNNEISRYRMEGEVFSELDAEGSVIQGSSVPSEIEDVLKQSLDQQWLLPKPEDNEVTCNDFQSYVGKLEGKEERITVSFTPGETEEARVIFDSGT